MDDERVDVEQLKRQLAIEIAERLDIQERLRESQDKLTASFNTLHDVNNQLLVIHYACQQLLLSVAENDPARTYVSAIERARIEASNATKSLRSMSSNERQQPTIELNRMVHEVATLFTGILPDGLILTSKISPSTMEIAGEPKVLWTTIVRLVANSLLACGPFGWVTIETYRSRGNRADQQNQHGAEFICLRISDTRSVTSSVEHLVQNSGHTSLEAPKLASQTSQDLEGMFESIRMIDRVDEGASITISFPSSVEPDPREAVPVSHISLTEPQLTILLVDDESQIRRMLRALLERNGYRVLEAADAQEAISIGLDENIQLNLLLTDYHLPHASGVDVTKSLQARFPNLPVILMSGSGTLDDSILDSGARFEQLPKPFQPNELLRQVHMMCGHSVPTLK